MGEQNEQPLAADWKWVWSERGQRFGAGRHMVALFQANQLHLDTGRENGVQGAWNPLQVIPQPTPNLPTALLPTIFSEAPFFITGM